MKVAIPILLLLLAAPAGAAETGAAIPATPVTQAALPAPAPLIVGGREVIVFRAAPSGRGPKERVEAARRHLLAAYDLNKNPRPSLRTVPGGTQVLVDGRVMFIVVDGDADLANGETPEDLAKRSIERLKLVLEEIAERKDPRTVLTGIGLAVVFTLVWILVVRGIIALDRRVGTWAARRAGEKAQRIRFSGVEAIDAGNVIRVVRIAVRMAAWASGLFVSFLWFNASLTAVPQTRPLGERLGGILYDTLATVGHAMLDALPGLFFVAVIIAIARVITRAGARFFDRVRDRELSFGWLDRDTAPPTRMIFTIVVWLFALAMAYPYIPGSQSEAFKGLSVLFGLMVSIGASGTVGQATSGLILMYSRAFRIGEFIQVQDTEGTVVELGLFATRIRTGMGEEVMLPNTVVVANRSKNYSRVVPGAGFVVDTVVTIGYDTPWRQVQAMLVEAARRVESIASEPAPRVMQTALSDFYVEYRLVAYSKASAPLPRAEVMNRLHASIQDVFNEYGVQIMSPHYLGDPETEKVVPKARWYEKPAVAEGGPGSAGA